MRYLILFLCFIVTLPGHALSLRANAPSHYIVQPGDTLWTISCRFLENPWEWQSLWHANPGIKNPNRLYPGAVLELHQDKSQPYLKVLSNGTIKISPSVRKEPFDQAILPIPLSDIEPFLDSSLILDHDALINAPYVIAFTNEHMLGGQGDSIYVKNLSPNPHYPSGKTLSYGIYRPGGQYWNPKTKAFLGYRASLIGYAELTRIGDPSTVVLTDITQAVKLLDRVMPDTHPGFSVNFEPKSPSRRIQASIIDLPGDYTQGAEGLVVVLDQGKNCDLQPGDVLGVYSPTHRMTDLQCPFGCVRIPPVRIGEVMVFRTFTHTSFALVVRSTQSINIGDGVANP